MKKRNKQSFKSNLKNMDIILFIFMIVFSILGLVMIYSASNVSAVLRYQVPTNYFFKKQLFFALVSFFFGISFLLNTKLIRYKKLSVLFALGIIVILVLTFSYGVIVNGSRSWFTILGVRIQPSEFAKTFIILFFAYFYGLHKEDKGKYAFMIPLVLVLIVVVLVAAQPDLGTALIIAGMSAILFFAIPLAKNNKTKFFKIAGIGIVIFAIVFMYTGSSFLNSNQLKRLNFRDPCSRYTEDTGYQVCNGFIAITNGGLFGVGLGNSTQKYLYLPEAHTDFIFPIICEELGSIVACLIIIGYSFILYRILKIAKSSSTLYGSIIAYGTFAMLLMHLLINLLGVLALIPLTGVSLPFLSSGGSFYINVVVLLFLTERVAIETKRDKELREIANLK